MIKTITKTTHICCIYPTHMLVEYIMMISLNKKSPSKKVVLPAKYELLPILIFVVSIAKQLTQ